MSKMILGHVAPLAWPKFREDAFGRLDAELERMFGDFLAPKSLQRIKGDHYPKADVFKFKDSQDLCIELAVPGSTHEDLEVALEEDGRVLAVSGKMSFGKQDNLEFFQKELRRSEFVRSWSLSKKVTEKDLQLDLQAGLLRIRILNYFEEEKPKKKILKLK